MLVVGLTGNIASGKSSVARLLTARGVPVIDADALAREAVAPGTPALQAIVARWGPSMLAADGTLDRPALRAVVFRDAAEREALDAIVHPAVGAARNVRLAALEAAGAPIVVCDIPLLFETGLDRECDLIIVVDAPEEERLARLRRDRHLTDDEARAMIAAQMPASEKRPFADYVIANVGSTDALAQRVHEVWDAIESGLRNP
jgi:dephospho-CoA kinase